jgi:hypothetical protein
MGTRLVQPAPCTTHKRDLAHRGHHPEERVAAHSSGDKSYLRVLSVYDVANVQFLARRLLLESLGYWRYLGTHENLRRLTAPAAARAPNQRGRRLKPRVSRTAPRRPACDSESFNRFLPALP